MRDPYQVLGVGRSADAKDIKAAYRKLAKKYHPDQNRDDPKAQDRFAELNQAYEIVGDEDRRRAFDRGEIGPDGKPVYQGFDPGAAGGDPFGAFRRGGGPGNAHFQFRSAGGPQRGFPGGDDIFSELFGQAFGQAGGAGAGTRSRPAADDKPVTLRVSLREAATGAKVTATLAGGRKLAVKLPRFVEDGQTIRLKGQGEAGGDALVQIRFGSDPQFRLDGRDLHTDLDVPLQDAVLGAKLPVETLAGRVAVTVPAWTSSDRIFRVKGRGLPLKGTGDGDLFVHVRIMLPDGMRDELEALARRARAEGDA